MSTIYDDAIRQRAQMTDPELTSTNRSMRETLRTLDGRIMDEERRSRLPLFESSRADDVARLRSLHSAVARQVAVAEHAYRW
jgi:hypothetical protein